MAVEIDAVPQNEPGVYFVDSSCMYCGLCVEAAPVIFGEWKLSGWAYVAKQPTTVEEVAWVEALILQCPLDSIGMHQRPNERDGK